MKEAKKHLNELDIAKGIGIICVVLGHAFPDAELGLIKEYSISSYLFSLCYAFHMPLFMLLAGFLTAPRLDTISDTKLETYKRFKRLMVPYLFYSLSALCLKIFFNAYANNPLDIANSWRILIGESPNGSAWFLWTLFTITLIVIVLRKINIKIILVLALLLYIGESAFPDRDSSFFMFRIAHNLLWFVLGCSLYPYYQSICRIVGNRAIIYGIFSFVVLCLVHLYFNYLKADPLQPGGLFKQCVNLFEACIGIASVWLISYSIANNANGLKFLGTYSMDIYLLSYYVQVPLRVIYYNTNYLSGVSYPVFVLISVILGVSIPLIVSKYFIRKIKIVRTLFLGMN